MTECQLDVQEVFMCDGVYIYEYDLSTGIIADDILSKCVF